MTKKAKTRGAPTARLRPGLKILAAQNAASTSKYQSEAEKNLNRVLAAAPSSNISLAVDDADELFGKRSTTKPR